MPAAKRTPKPKPVLAKVSIGQPSTVPTPPLDLPSSYETNFSGKLEQPTTVSTELLHTLCELGRGAYGIVEKVRHTPTGHIFAVKRIRVTINDEEQRRMLVELQASIKSSQCQYLVSCYGAMFRDGDVWICMEMMDTSLDKFYRMCLDVEKPLNERCTARIALCTIRGLDYMKREMSLMHRDVKPSNLLLSRDGQVKICDFGISGHLTNSVAKTVNAGCKPYMAPEKIDGDHRASYDVRSDIWSLAISLIEITTGVHPYSKWRTPFEQLKQVVHEPAPSLPAGDYSLEFRDFIRQCLQKDFTVRPKYAELMEHVWIKSTASSVPIEELSAFVSAVLDAYEQMKSDINIQ